MNLIVMKNAPKKVLEKCAQLYCNIWKEPPWNENFWTQQKVMEDIKQQMALPLSRGFIAILIREPYNYERMDLCGAKASGYSEVDLMEPVGFVWGYEVNAEKLQEISGVSALEWEKAIGSNRTFYIDELGVDIDHRRKGLGEILVAKLLKQMPWLGVTRVILRTDKGAVAARNLFQKLGFKEVDITDATYSGRTYWLKRI